MACKSCAKKHEQMRYQVIAASGRTVYRTNNLPSAQKVAKRYPGALVKEKDSV